MLGQIGAQPQQPLNNTGQAPSLFNQQPLAAQQGQQGTSIFGQPMTQTSTLGQAQPLVSFGLQTQPNQQPAATGLGMQPAAQQPLAQPQQLQQSSAQPNQAAQPKPLNIQQIRAKTADHIENLTKTLTIKEKIDKNQKNLQLIERNALKNFQQQSKQAPTQILGFSQPQPQKPPAPKTDPRNHTAKVERYYTEWNKRINQIFTKQDEILKSLEGFNHLLASQDAYYDIDEETLIDLVNQLREQLEAVENKTVEVVQMQEEIMGLNRDESAWDQVVNNLSECLMLLDQQTDEVSEQLNRVEKFGANK